MNLSRLATERPVAVAMFFLAAIFLGLLSFRRLPIDLLPDIAYPRLVVFTQYSEVAPAEVERFVTEPIEQAVAAVPGVERVESVSREGVSLVTVRFVWGTEMDFAVLNVRESLDNIREALPERLDARPVVLRTDPASEPILAVTAAGDLDLWTLKDLAETVYKRRLEQIDGVAEAAVAGGLEREIQVLIDPVQLQSLNITIETIIDALDAANQSAPGGTIRRGRYRYALRTLGEFLSVEQVGDVVVPLAESGADGGQASRGTVRVRDVAEVIDGFEEREAIARFNGSEAVGLLVFKEGDANTVRVAREVDAVLERLRAEYPDIRLEVATSQAGFISDSISNVVQALVFGGVLAFIVLFMFLRDPRYPVAVSLAIPISVVATFALLDLADVSLNIMSLGGLALGVGMLVDNSIVVLENIFRHHENGLPMAEAAPIGANEVRGAITASTLTTISVFGPIIYVEGVAGQLFRPLSLAVAFSLLVSLVVALTLLPTMAARWTAGGADATGVRRALAALAQWIGQGLSRLVRPGLDAFDRAFRAFGAWYHRALGWALDHRGRVVAAAGLLLALGVLVGASLDRGVLPRVDQGEFRLRIALERGTSIEATEELAGRVEGGLREDPDIEAVFSRIGRQETVSGVENEESGLHTAVMDVRLAPRASTEQVLTRVGPVLSTVPGGALTVETGSATALGTLLGGGEADLAVRLRGDDLDVVLAYGRAVTARLQSIATLVNVRLGTELGQPEIQIEVDRERAAAYGIEPQAIARTIERYMRGERATEFVDFDRRIPIMVRLPERERKSLMTLGELRVEGIPVRELVRTQEAVGPAEIRRVEQSRVVSVLADVSGGGLDEAIAEVRHALTELPAPRGLRIAIGGENEERDRSFAELGFAFGLAVLLVYMILAAQFESFLHPLTILLSVPLSLVGAAVALWIAGAGLNTMSLIGVVVLVGIVVNDAIIKVDFINQMRAQGMAVREAILEAGRVRLRPIVMTTVTTVLGLTPMALGIGRGADLRAPLAIAIIGGLTSATVLTLVVVPVAYDLIEALRVRLGTLRPSVARPQALGGNR